MARSNRETAALRREQVVLAAARRIREQGLGGVSVPALMAEAGLTHGGFYKHFDSRDDLVAEAVEEAVAQSRDGFVAVTEGAEDPLATFVDWYLSPGHRDDPGSGCAVVALGADAARADERVRATYTGQVERYISQMEGLLGGEDEEVRRRAIAAVSEMVGALLIARAVDDEELSEEILAAARASTP
jgi:TetR/AcrR family transcriptional repressor of nem operon